MHERLRLILTGTLVFGPVVALGVPAPATAADEMCNGVPATIVGTPGGQVHGTPEDDVIVSNGAIYVGGGLGDDLICTTGTQHDKNRLISFDGGAGNNVIDRRGDADLTVFVSISLSGDADVLYGSDGPEQVSLTSRQVDAGPVSVHTAGGDDTVFIDHETQFAEPSTVDTGPGDDRLATYGGVNNLQVSDGDGNDILAFADYEPSRWKVDARKGLATFGDGVQLGFSGFDTYFFTLSNPRTRVMFLGSPRGETVSLEGRGQIRKARLGRGDDVVRFERFALPTTDLAGGGGRDTVVLLADRKRGVNVDLPGRFFAMGAGLRNPLKQFENVSVEGGRVRIIGDAKDNEIEWWGCEGGIASGGDGDDSIGPTGGPHACGAVSFDATGGLGDDRLTGSKRRDVLDGGPGRDKADGGPGVDACPASEVVRSCERS
jgi:hypothetical protein